MRERMEQIILDFITVYLHDRIRRKDDEFIEDELDRLYLECEVNASELLDLKEYM